MKLTDLNPHWNDETKHDYLIFDCPARHDHQAGTPYAFKCQIVLPIKPTENGWTWESGDSFANATIRASVWHHCEKDPHFYITNGNIELL